MAVSKKSMINSSKSTKKPTQKKSTPKVTKPTADKLATARLYY